jgi:hypothetical protein
MRKTALRGALAAGIAVVAAIAAAFGISSCSSPLLTRVKQEIAKYPFTASSYRFVRQWGNAHPEWSFYNPIVKTDTAGFVYVTDSSSRIRKYDGAGAIKRTISLVSTQGLGGSVKDMAFDSAGNMYVATNNANQIQKYDVNGNFLLDWGGTTQYGASLLTLSGPRGIAVDSAGNVYIADSGCNRIVKFDSSGSYVVDWGGATTWGSSTPSATMSYPRGIVIDKFNYIYVVDYYNNRILKFNPVATTAPTLNTDWGGATLYGSPTGYALSYPQSISISPGNTQFIYVVDGGGTNNSRILKFYNYGTYVTDWGNLGTGNGQFTSPTSAAVDTSGNLYATDGSSSDLSYRVQKFDGATAPPTWMATWGGAPGSANGVFAWPWGIAVDKVGNVYVSEAKNARIQKFDAYGNFISMGGSSGNGSQNLSNPAGLAIDAAGNVLVADMGNNRIQVFDSTATNVTKAIGTGLSSPSAVGLDGLGNIFIADAGHAVVKVFDSSGYASPTLPVFGAPGTGDGQFQITYGLAVDSGGNTYVTDATLCRVQKFDSTGTLLTKWGTQGSATGQFNFPFGITVDNIGNVYVCDMLNRRVQKFDSNGSFLTSIGGVGVGNGTFAWPMWVAVNSAGHLFVTDYLNYLVQEFEPAQ